MQQLHLASSRSAGAGGKIPVAVCVYQECLRVAYPEELNENPGFHEGTCAITLLKHSLTTNQILASASASHREPVECLTFSSESHPLVLCSASRTYTFLWNVEAIHEGHS